MASSCWYLMGVSPVARHLSCYLILIRRGSCWYQFNVIAFPAPWQQSSAQEGCRSKPNASLSGIHRIALIVLNAISLQLYAVCSLLS